MAWLPLPCGRAAAFAAGRGAETGVEEERVEVEVGPGVGVSLPLPVLGTGERERSPPGKLSPPPPFSPAPLSRARGGSLMALNRSRDLKRPKITDHRLIRVARQPVD